MTGVDDIAVEGGGDPVGTLWVRGPSVGALLRLEETDGAGNEGWADIGERAKVLPNGTFKVSSK